MEWALEVCSLGYKMLGALDPEMLERHMKHMGAFCFPFGAKEQTDQEGRTCFRNPNPKHFPASQCIARLSAIARAGKPL